MEGTYNLGESSPNLLTHANYMWNFYKDHGYWINRTVKNIIEQTQGTSAEWGANRPKRSDVYLMFNAAIGEAFKNNASNQYVSNTSNSYRAAAYQISAIAGVETGGTYNYRSRATRPFGTSPSARGGFQIQFKSDGNHKGYSNIFNVQYTDSDAYRPQIQNIPYNQIPESIRGSAYDFYDASTRVIRRFSDKASSIIEIRNKHGIQPASENDPMLGPWGLYLYWNQGSGNGPEILDAYLDPSKRNNPISTYTGSPAQSWAKGHKKLTKSGRSISVSPGDLTVKEWVDAMRWLLNVYFYISCNACVARALNYKVFPSGTKYQSIINNGTLDCKPLQATSQGYANWDGINTYPQGASKITSNVIKPAGNPARRSTAHSYANQNTGYYDTQASRQRQNAHARNYTKTCDCGFVANTSYEFEVKYRKNEQAIDPTTKQKRRDWLYLEFIGNFDNKKSVLIYIK